MEGENDTSSNWSSGFNKGRNMILSWTKQNLGDLILNLFLPWSTFGDPKKKADYSRQRRWRFFSEDILDCIPTCRKVYAFLVFILPVTIQMAMKCNNLQRTPIHTV